MMGHDDFLYYTATGYSRRSAISMAVQEHKNNVVSKMRSQASRAASSRKGAANNNNNHPHTTSVSLDKKIATGAYDSAPSSCAHHQFPIPKQFSSHEQQQIQHINNN